MDALAPQTEIDTAELIDLCSVDSELFCATFFPKTVRQASPPFHTEMDKLLDSNHRLINILSFRGSAKTSKLRMYTAKRIAYGLAHTILYVGKSEGHAVRSVKWIKRAVQHNKQFSTVFNLRPGDKWQDVEAEIWHGTDEYPVWIMGTGITGSVRGINQDDFRPDLIILDDCMNEENSATPDSRNKISELIYGALIESLAPASEMPDAKLVMLQTPQNKEDAASLAFNDSAWKSARFGCWTPESEGLPLQLKRSIWPVRWPDAVLRKEKQEAITRNKLSLFLREKECKIVSPETSAFLENWLKFYELEPAERMVSVLVIDPVPPPSPIQIAKGLRGKDFEALSVISYYNGGYYLREYSVNRGHEPDWTIAEFFRLCYIYHPRRVIVESVAYQRTLAWLLKQAMKQQKKYWVIKETDDKRSKYDKIVDGLNGPASNGQLFVKKEHTDFIEQFRSYPDVSNDDLIETVAIGVADLSGEGIGEDEGEGFRQLMKDEANVPRLIYDRGAP